VAKYGGVLERRGHTEAGIDLCVLAGTQPTGLLCEMTNDDGTMMRLPACEELAEKLGLKIINIEQLAKFREAEGLTGRLAKDNKVALRVQGKVGGITSSRV
jgi:3,4-dihydroxy 2-butanone 4-phosphate synthase/GTP cyclohydrolase II